MVALCGMLISLPLLNSATKWELKMRRLLSILQFVCLSFNQLGMWVQLGKTSCTPATSSSSIVILTLLMRRSEQHQGLTLGTISKSISTLATTFNFSTLMAISLGVCKSRAVLMPKTHSKSDRLKLVS